MAKVTIRMCDVEGCEKIGTHRLGVIVYGKRDDPVLGEGWHLMTEQRKDGIDLCGQHEYEYRSNLPEIKLKAPA